jgi:putative ABC transport system permease protein
MLENYIKIGWRNLVKQKMYALIKIGGFAIGIASCLLIALFIRQELSYDLHYPDGDRIYRVVEHYHADNGEVHKGVSFPAPMGNVLKEDFPEVEKVGRFNAGKLFGAGSNSFRRTDKTETFHEEGFAYADQTLLEILRVPFIYGDLRQALSEPNSMVITRSKADKYFPNEDPIGKTVILNNDNARIYKIGGVIEDLPATSHLEAYFLITLTAFERWPGEQTNWHSSNYMTYIMLHQGADKSRLEKKLLSLVKKYYLPRMIESGETNPVEKSKKSSFALQPVKDIHLNLDGVTDDLPHGDIRYIWLFGAIAAFILIIACINFINLSTAKSANRAREVGIRKVAGSLRNNLIKQFLTESILYSFFSFAVAVLMACLLLPYFNSLLGKPVTFPWNEWWLLPTLIAGALIVGILAGLYPSFYLSSFRPIQVLKGDVSRGSKSSPVRNVLVVFQFVTSIGLIVSTAVIYRQMEFVLNKKLGFDKDQVLLVQSTNMIGDQVSTFRDELLQLPGVKTASISDYLPVDGTARDRNGFWTAAQTKEDRIGCQIWRVDHDYVKTMGMKILEGRDFSREMPSDSQAVIINQAMAKALGMKDPLGQRITNGWEGFRAVIGVMEDFHFESMQETIRPLCLALGSSPSIVSVKVSTNDMPGLIHAVTAAWKKFSPDLPIRYNFLDERYAVMYSDVERMGRIFSSFAALAITVACLGLFALSAFMVEQRGKEISIRLVLGASVNNIFQLLTGNFIKLVMISLIIAAPVAWYTMQKWLEDFAYRIDIGWDVFLLSGLMSVGIALLTISYQSIRAALIDPVKNLKSE